MRLIYFEWVKIQKEDIQNQINLSVMILIVLTLNRYTVDIQMHKFNE